MNKTDFIVVCVDDDADVLEITAEKVQALGQKTQSFLNVEEALDYIQNNKHKISLVLSDLRMDHINGFKFKKLLKKTADEIPFVIITGYWTKEISAEAMENGVDAFIEKPLSNDALREILEKFAQERIELLTEEQEMVEGFLDESAPMLDEIEQLILELEEDPNSEETLAVYFRLLHTIKGTASCVGLTRLGDYTHKYEDFIVELRNKTVPVNTKSMDVLLAGLDDLKHFFTLVQNEKVDSFLDTEQRIGKYNLDSSSDLSAPSMPNMEKDMALDKNESKSVPEKDKDKDKMSVPMSTLNAFMEESGELTVIRNSISKTVKLLEGKYRGDKEIEALNDLLDDMFSVTSNIQGKITEMRKSSLKNTFRPFKRLVRDLSKQLGKRVNLEVEGEEILVDNFITKLYSNTLIHLLRNSLDHGLETAEQRETAGKNPVGLLKIVVREEGEDIVLKIQDDGKGINAAIIKEKALEKGLYTAEQLDQMSSLEIINIIFDSGFSTAEQVSDLSGRGVGMDMVRGSFVEMGGNVYVQSEAGKGSTFTLRVPVPKSVLIVNTLSVRVGQDFFLFHMDEVAEVIRHEQDSDRSKMYAIDSKLVLDHNHEMIPLTDLKQVFGEDNIEYEIDTKEVHNIVVLRVGKTKFGLLVDEIFDFEEVVSRKISEYIESKHLFHGASVFGSGDVAMILSAEGIAHRCGIHIDKKVQAIAEDMLASDTESLGGSEYMLFKYEADKFLALELDHVKRLEKFHPATLEMIGDNYIVRYADKVLPIVDPAHMLGFKKNGMEHILKEVKQGMLDVIVISTNGHHYGLVVFQLDEIKKSYEAINADTIINQGLKGTAYIDGRTISVVDLLWLDESYRKIKYKLPGMEIKLGPDKAA